MNQLYLVLSAIIVGLVFSQGQVFCQCSEKIDITTDRDIYFTGEPVWYSLNCLNSGSDKPSPLSKVAYLELLTVNSVPISQYKLYLNNGQNNSRIIIPDTLATGIYVLRGYTNWMKNYGTQVSSIKLISVINPFHRNKFVNLDQIGSTALYQGEGNRNSGIELESLLKEYKHRSPVELNIKNINGLNNLSVSVVKQALINKKTTEDENLNNQIISNLNKKATSNKYRQDFLPEMEGEIISGTIKNKKDNSPFINQVVTLAFVGKVPLLYLSKTDSSGRFRFVVNQFGAKDIVIQPLTRDTTNLEFSIDIAPSFIASRDSITVKRHPVDEAFIDEISECIKSMQIEALYKLYGNKKEITVPGPVNYCFYGEPESKVVLSTYIDLPTINEVFKEIVPNVGVRDNKRKSSFIVFGTSGIVRNSFTIVDGIYIKDLKKIMSINPEDIKQIDVINSSYFLQDQELGAIISIQTHKGDLSAIDFDNRIFRQEFPVYEYLYNFSMPDYSIDSIYSSPLADFRNLLYWNPSVKSDHNGSDLIKFYTSDDSGSYMVIIEGITSDGSKKRVEVPFSVVN